MEPTRASGDRGKSAELLEPAEINFTSATYIQFNAQMDVQLEHLVARWQHLAAPSALRVGRISARGRNRQTNS
jgi:hypothetical protein